METHEQILERYYADEAQHQLRYNYLLDENSLVWDLGAYKGEWASKIYSKYKCHIFAFEPVEEFYQELVTKAEGTKIIPIQMGIGGTTRTDKINLLKDGSSLHDVGEFQQEIKIISASEYFKCNNFDQVHLIKLNIEGEEFDLLENLIENNLHIQFVDMQIQFHPTVENYQERYNKIREKLLESHHITYEYPWVWENYRRN